jgi:hypothetical protein
MARSGSSIGRRVAEALIVIPLLSLGVAWSGVILAGAMDATLVDRHRPEVERLMSLLLIGCVASFIAGVILYVLTRGPRLVE